ncbi:hypothetical protein MIMGU_mgv1a0051981mg, partial [Erythranthe guttata]
MEIDKAINESDDVRLKTKYNNAVYVIQRALALYSVEEVALSLNGGKDSTLNLPSRMLQMYNSIRFYVSRFCWTLSGRAIICASLGRIPP